MGMSKTKERLMKGKQPVIASISSGKGGVGKTFVSVNIGACLARQGNKVLIVDCDLGLANVDVMIGVNPKFTLKEVVFGEADIADVAIKTRYGFDFVPASSGAAEMVQLMYEDIEKIKEALGRLAQKYDLVILDTGAGISESVLQFNLFANKNVIILNRELTSLTDAYATIKVIYQAFGRDSFDIIVNTARSEEDARKIFNHINAICRRFLGFPLHYLGHIAYDEEVPRSIMKQELLVHSHGQSPPAIHCTAIAEKMVNWQ
jgi:flagellar biosynthesis protein FlhG